MLLPLEAACLLVLTIVLAGPVSVRLARARWVAAAPRAGLVLWQAVGLGGGLGIVTAGLTLAAADLDRHWLGGVVALPHRWHELGFWGWFGIGISVAVGVYLIGNTAISAVRVTAARRSHRRQLSLISRAVDAAADPLAGRARRGDAPVHLVDHPVAISYGLPGLRPRVVLTRGVLDALTPAELRAVLTHEQAHARGRHDLVIQPFQAWAATLPFLPAARGALAAVGTLVEMLADDAAIRGSGREPLRTALGKLTGQHLDVGGRDSGPWREQLAARLRRLGPEAPPRLSGVRVAGIYALAAALVVGPPALLLAS